MNLPYGGQLRVVDSLPEAPYTFASSGPEPSAHDFGGPLMDPERPVGPRAEAGTGADPVLDAFFAAIRAGSAGSAGAAGAAVRAVWLAWRTPLEDARWPPPWRVFVVEVDEIGDAPTVAAYLQQVVSAAGAPEAGIEVYGSAADDELCDYQIQAREWGRLVYVRDARPSLRMVPVYDDVDEEVPRISPDHPLLDDPERIRVLDYLHGEQFLERTEFDLQDVVRPEAGAVVPAGYDTDGRWVWFGATWYYLMEYGLAPDPEFLAHIRQSGYVCPPVDGVDRRRAEELVDYPPDSPVWEGILFSRDGRGHAGVQADGGGDGD
ncbi:hypothetical protein ND748_23315 [Frankia sp. AiPs1]|uniref:hypothetical protein n=1 Tax=Frankia sp. AiPs1 TaxID=573493 RepID=UPI0020433597|nr:hypothetical protein [Frankia sp. AiPs1]MCM3924581.1 hypothetical protein [Frankia sp. AiPs1]